MIYKRLYTPPPGPGRPGPGRPRAGTGPAQGLFFIKQSRIPIKLEKYSFFQKTSSFLVKTKVVELEILYKTGVTRPSRSLPNDSLCSKYFFYNIKKYDFFRKFIFLFWAPELWISPRGYFLMLNSILMVPGPPDRLNNKKKLSFLIFKNYICFWNFRIFQKIGFLAYLIAPGVPGPLKSNSASKSTSGDLSTASDHKFFIDFHWFSWNFH